MKQEDCALNDFMTEQLVERRTTADTMLKKAGLIALTVFVGFATMMFIPQFMVFAVMIMIVLDVFLFNRMNLEYEYSYFGGDITIAKIFNKQSRKTLISVNMKDVDIIAPTESAELRPYGQLKTLYCSSCEPHKKTYTMVTKQKEQKVKVIFEPNEELIKGLRMAAPRKVIY